MSLLATEHNFTGATTPIASYDSTKTNLGTLMTQRTGRNPEDNFAGPMPVSIARPMEESTPLPMMFPHVLSISDTIDWVFVTENATGATATRRVFLYEYNKVTGTYNRNGMITATFPVTSTTTRGFRALRYLHTTGTVAVAAPVSVYATGTVTVVVAGTVTHSGTGFLPAYVGLMIGFGSTDVTKINCWYPIISNTSTSVLVVSGISSAYAAGTSFVIASCVVTGTSTQFVTEGIAAGANAISAAGLSSGLGARIGFGNTDPNLITQWYQIGRITSDTSINLVTSPGVIAAGTPYVIEELRFVWTLTHGTATSGGLFLLKGAGFMDFTTAGNTFPFIASNINNERGVYKLRDAATVTNTIADGCAVEPEINKLTHFAYVLDATTAASIRIFKYNLRSQDAAAAGYVNLLAASYYTTGTVTVSLGVVTGVGTTFTAAMVGKQIGFGSTTASAITTWYTIFSYSSGTSITLTDLTYNFAGTAYVIDLSNIIITATLTSAITGNISTNAVNNGTIATLKHGPGADLPYFYFVSVSRLYCAALSSIGAGHATWVSLANGRQEIPPGGVSTIPASGAMQNVQYIETIDRLVITTYASGAAYRQYVTRYPEGSSTYNVPFDHIFGADDKQQDQSLMSSLAAIHFNTGSQLLSLDASANGIVHIIKNNTAATLNQMYALPFGAHWTYAYTTSPANHQRIITPSMSTAGCVKFDQVLVVDEEFIGGGELRLSPEAFRVYYRTTDIATDAISSWTLLGYDGDLSSVPAAEAIQFMFEFYIIGMTCLPARLFKVIVTYEDSSTDSHYQLSVGLSDITAKTFTWRFSMPFGGTVPTLKVLLFNAETGASLPAGDTTLTTANGTWSKSIDGGSNWIIYDTNDKGNEITYIRYTSTSALTDDVRVRVVLNQN